MFLSPGANPVPDGLARYRLGVAHQAAHAAKALPAVVAQDALQHHVGRHRVMDALDLWANGVLALGMGGAESGHACIAQVRQQFIIGQA